MRKLIILGSFLGLLTSCHAQEPQQKSKKSNEVHTETKTPHGNWHVNKRYDKNGNLVQMDSTYTYNWSSSTGNNPNSPQSQAKVDSLMHKFQQYAKANFAAMGNGNFFNSRQNRVKSDTTGTEPFFSQDRQMQMPGFGNSMGNMQAQMQQMDSLQQQVMKQFFGKGMVVPPNENEQNDQKKTKKETKKSLPNGRQI